MTMKKTAIVGVVLFSLFCGWLVVDAIVHHPQQTKQLIGRVVPLAGELNETDAIPAEPIVPPAEIITNTPVVYPQLAAPKGSLQKASLGALYPDVVRTEDPEKYKFMVFLTSQGAAIERIVLSEFKSRTAASEAEALSADASETGKVINPLTLLSPLSLNGKEVFSLANTALKVAPANADQFDSRAFPLDKLNWSLIETDSKDEVRFEAILNNANTNTDMLKVIKTYRVQPGSYDLNCDIAVENLTGNPIKVLMQMQGPGGMSREAVRMDARKVKVAYRPEGGDIALEVLDVAAMQKKIKKNDTDAFKVKGKNNKNNLIWSAVTNKYFAAIVRSLPVEGQSTPWLTFDKAQYYPAPTEDPKDKNLHNGSFIATSQPITLATAGQDNAKNSFSLQMYAGPKDKKIFENNETYRNLGFFKTIDFRGCCCPQSIIAPLAFGIMWLMNTMYTLMGPLGNYGVVIMILVFLVRLAMHPITKKSQVSMMKMQKLGPKMQEIQKKYANNKAEMNKQVMAMYREQGVSPVSGMLPMFLQMPIWIALWTAVNTSIDIRGAGFLPVWITDLASPDQLFAIPYAAQLQTIPYVGAVIPSYFNLLPILMGVVMYLQQKMMPSSQASAQTNPQMAQQQKMMMIMMPLMFPIMLYSGPSGVNLYILSSITAGVIEQKVIRKHLKEQQEQADRNKVPVTSKTGGKVKKKKPKPFFKG